MIQTEVKGFAKPAEIGPLLNTDKSALESYRKQKKLTGSISYLIKTVEEQKQEINTLKQRMEEIENAISRSS